MRKSVKVSIVAFVMLGAFVYLISLGIKEGSMYYLEVSEFIAQKNELGVQKVRINGAVIRKSMDYDTKSRIFAFTLKDINGPETLKVRYRGAPPDLVDEKGVTIVAEGIYDASEGIFMSTKLLVKCPSKYEKQEGKV